MLQQYALVAYVRSPLAEFVDRLRGELCPDCGYSPAHISVLPPRPLSGSEAEALQLVEGICQETQPFEIVMGEVQTFSPITPTVFVRVAHAAYRMRELHDRLNAGVLKAKEPWPYMPHLTLVKMKSTQEAADSLAPATRRWTEYTGSRRISIGQLTFVRSMDMNSWIDIVDVPLGRTLATHP